MESSLVAGKHIGLQIYWKKDSIEDFFLWYSQIFQNCVVIEHFETAAYIVLAHYSIIKLWARNYRQIKQTLAD